MENFRSGFIALVGKPNAGKSTLLNSLVRQKVSIVSPKPQTTRNKILGIWTQDDCQMVFVDMPGIIKPKNTLGKYMEKSIDSGVRDVDCVVFVTDGHKGISDDDVALMTRYSAGGAPMVVVVTKTDICQPETLMTQLAKLNGLPFVGEVYCVSAKRNKNIDMLKDGLKKYLKDDVKYFDDDDVTDKSQRFLAAEIIREKILLLCDDEIPHGVGVTINKMTYDKVKKMWDIDANIIVEKASHKPIIIGKQGRMLKQIGSYAREGLEKMLQAKVYLALWIKIKEDWRNSDFMLKEIGYDKKEL
ncbi:MAG TPA: GTPase Era [Firmicutes bacterium]|nr:GTPase Era [Bacillota bacterium]